MPTRNQQRYARSLRDIAKRYSRLDDQTLRRLISLLQDSRRRIAAQLLNNPSEFTSFHLRRLQSNIDLIVSEFQASFATELRNSFNGATLLGQASVIEPLEAINVNAAVALGVNPVTNVALDFSAELVRNIADDMRQSINTQLRLAVLGEQSPFQAMQAVTRALGIKAKDGVWGRRRRPEVVRGVAARSEAIVRTEMTRIFNLAHSSQQQATAEIVPDLRKRWLATGDDRTRETHIRAHRATMDEPIPITEPFSVGGAALMFPGDPAGPAAETIRCRCTMSTVHPEIGVIETPLDELISSEIEQREKQAA